MNYNWEQMDEEYLVELKKSLEGCTKGYIEAADKGNLCLILWKDTSKVTFGRPEGMISG